MSKKFFFLFLVFVLVLGAILPAAAQEGAASVPVAEAENSPYWFVELSGNPAADGGSVMALAQEKNAFRGAAAKAKIQYAERFAFDTLWNGFSVEASSENLAKLARLPGVKNIYPVDVIAMPEIQPGADPELSTALAMTGADVAQSELGFTGAGIKVAVMDTGLDYDHPDLGGCFGPGCRVAFGYDLVGDAFNADSTSAFYNPVAVPDPDPDDCNGHGTHVSGIIGANGVVTGVAPGVTFGAYRVFGCEGSTTSDIMIAAMERALADDMDVLNMSIGSSFQWPQYPTAVAASKLVNKGMVVVASIGNSGASGLYAAGAPGLGEKVIGVAAYDNIRMTSNAFSISPDGKLIGYGNATAAPIAPLSGSGELIRTGTQTTVDDGCAALAPGSLAGKIALIRRGTCGFYNKALNAQTVGAIAVVLYNNQPGSVNPTVAPVAPLTTPIVIPVVMISQVDGNLIDTRLAAEPVTLTWTTETVYTPIATAGLISSFSSYGLSPDLALKPDIGAPGGNIWSTYPLEKGGYANLGGTSMSSPHVAGAAALLLQAKPNTPSQAVRGILQNSADPKPWWGAPTAPYLDNVHRQGAGMLDIDDAILATTMITPAKISAGESEAGPYSEMLTIENTGGMDVTYDLSYVNALSTGGVITPSFWGSDASVSFNMTSVKVNAGGTASIMATIYPATGPVNGQYGGYIVFTPQGGGQVYRVPFAGFVGDYQSIQVLAPTANGFPRLGWTPNGINFGFAGEGDIFTMQGNDIPFFLVHLDHQSRLFRVEIFSQKGKSWFRAYNEEYMGRNSTTTGFFAFPFDGTTFAGNKAYTVPNGTYYAVISVLKANGDADNPAHWETWTSPEFVISRP